LGKVIEKAFVKQLLLQLRNQGLSELEATYLPTAKNAQVADFYDKCGFALVSENEGAKSYQIDLAKADLEIEKYYHIKLK
jgi:predicted enzyme involved in methoxymalonyl-ACP biosynthesis